MPQQLYNSDCTIFGCTNLGSTRACRGVLVTNPLSVHVQVPEGVVITPVTVEDRALSVRELQARFYEEKPEMDKWTGVSGAMEQRGAKQHFLRKYGAT